MSLSKYRIPKVGAAVLLLGGCSEDTSASQERPGGGSGNGAVIGGKVDNNGSVRGGQMDNNGEDTGTGAGAGVDVSPARRTRAANAFCRFYADCYPDDFRDYYGSQTACIADHESYFSEYVDTFEEDCADALFDVLECGAKAGCASDPSKVCLKEQQAVENLCPSNFPYGDGDDDYEYDYDYGYDEYSSARRKRREVRARIPQRLKFAR